jgi:uncharacterized protein YggE
MTNEPVIAVRGEIHREVDAEVAEFHVGVNATDKDRATTLRRLGERVAAVRAVLDGFADAIERHETSRLSVRAMSKRTSEKIIGYTGHATTTVVVADLDRVGELMLRVADLDLVDVSGPYWGLRPASPVYRQAREAAIGEAVVRAREYAHALGARVTGLVELADTGMSTSGAPAARGMGFAAAMSDGGAPELDLDPQRQTVYANVAARFTISPPTAIEDPLD